MGTAMGSSSSFSPQSLKWLRCLKWSLVNLGLFWQSLPLSMPIEVHCRLKCIWWHHFTRSFCISILFVRYDKKNIEKFLFVNYEKRNMEKLGQRPRNKQVGLEERKDGLLSPLNFSSKSEKFWKKPQKLRKNIKKAENVEKSWYDFEKSWITKFWRIKAKAGFNLTLC